MPRLDYSRTSEIPAALGKLSSEELGSVLEARLRGESAGLPAPDRDEDPGAILRYAFDQGDAAFKERFKQVLAQVLGRNLRALALADSPALNGRRRLLEGVFFLIGQTGDREALPAVRRFLPVAEFLDTSLVQRLLGCIAALAGPEDDALIPWLLEKATASEYSRIALRGLYRIHRPTAAAALPAVAKSLLGGQQEASLLLARTLALLLPSLPDTEQVEFIKQVGASLRQMDSPAPSELLIGALDQTPGISPRAMRLAQFWTLRPVENLPPVVREDPSVGPPFPEDRVRKKAAREAERKLHAALAHIAAMEKLLKKLKVRRSDRPSVLRKIEQQITFVEKSQGKEPEDASYYAQTLTQLGTRLIGAGLFEQARLCLAKARDAAPWDPYPVTLEILIKAREGKLAEAEEVFAEAKDAGVPLDEAIYGALLDAYGKAGNLPEAEALFAEAKKAGLLNEVTYGALLDAYGKAGNLAKTEEVFAEAKEAGLVNEVTYGALLDAYGKAGNLAKAEEVLAEAKEAGLVSEAASNALLYAYGKAGNLPEAEALFAEAKEAGLLNEVTYSALLDAYGKAGNLPKAEAVFAEAKAARLLSEATYTAMLDAYGKVGNPAKSEEVFAEAKELGLLDQVTYSALLDAYGKAGNLPKAEAVFSEAKEAGLLDEVTHTALLDAYARAARIDDLLAAFDLTMTSGIKFSDYGKKVVATTLLKGLRTSSRRDDIFQLLPSDFLGEEIFLFYAKINPDPARALRRLEGFGEQSLAAQIVCRYREATKTSPPRYRAFQEIRKEAEESLEAHSNLSGFSQVHLAETLSRCWSGLENWQGTVEAWKRIAKDTLTRGPRMTFLAGHGRDSVVWGLHSHEDLAAIHALVSVGTREVLQAVSLERGSDLRLPDASIAYSEVVAAMSQVRSGIGLLPPAEKKEVLELLRSSSAGLDWHAALEDFPEVGPDEFNEVRAGRQAAIELLQMAV